MQIFVALALFSCICWLVLVTSLCPQTLSFTLKCPWELVLCSLVTEKRRFSPGGREATGFCTDSVNLKQHSAQHRNSENIPTSLGWHWLEKSILYYFLAHLHENLVFSSRAKLSCSQYCPRVCTTQRSWVLRAPTFQKKISVSAQMVHILITGGEKIPTNQPKTNNGEREKEREVPKTCGGWGGGISNITVGDPSCSENIKLSEFITAHVL